MLAVFGVGRMGKSMAFEIETDDGLIDACAIIADRLMQSNHRSTDPSGKTESRRDMRPECRRQHQAEMKGIMGRAAFKKHDARSSGMISLLLSTSHAKSKQQ
jgi:hypothetical protein